MITRGIKFLDPVADTNQVDWLVVSREDCPDETTEQHLVARHFRIPHQPWGSEQAFVSHVVIRRSRRRVLFYQESGISL